MSLLRRVIGGVLRRLRQRQGLTLREVAAAAGVSVPYLSEIERGRKEASSEILAAVCRALGIHLSELLEEARDDLRRVERGERVGHGPRPNQSDRVPVARATSGEPRPRFGFHTDGPTACGFRSVTTIDSLPLPATTHGSWPLRAMSPERPLHVGATPDMIGPRLADGPARAGSPLGTSGLRVRLIAAAPAGRPVARTTGALARRRARTGRRRLAAR
ncbi:helix-turn-helix transcriptional regulator [Micromonospora sp. WMMA1363]|uniref:helix-turn-helix domain-containing protein n=1 Tax=Micromonospora sp. WMMA1363 TaxID=3053985 RepID=UPI00259C7077|nr:helix-turn-helix transcriptional regulator [Micromonospora sp. WMMA1363]MDM4722327.1 helix-turn-helix transcriptional regulator [Micromonospora sp. WMMA1363]